MLLRRRWRPAAHQLSNSNQRPLLEGHRPFDPLPSLETRMLQLCVRTFRLTYHITPSVERRIWACVVCVSLPMIMSVDAICGLYVLLLGFQAEVQRFVLLERFGRLKGMVVGAKKTFTWSVRSSRARPARWTPQVPFAQFARCGKLIPFDSESQDLAPRSRARDR